MNDDLEKWKVIQQKVFENRIVESFELFRRNGIEPILIKGWAAALNYPNSYDRLFTDIDLAVSREVYDKALGLIDANQCLYIDLHQEMRHLDTLEWSKLFERSRLIKLNGINVRILSSEDHLRVLCVHWLNDGGAHKERLWDIYYAIENRPVDFDWQQCIAVISDKRKEWIYCVIKLVERYLALRTDGIPEEVLEFVVPNWLIKSIEKEWNRDIKLRPLRFSQIYSGELIEQIKIRVPPNPVQATIEMNEKLNENSRTLIQLRNFMMRLNNSLKRALFKRK